MITLRRVRALSLVLAAATAPFAAPLLQDPKPAPAAQGEAKLANADKEKKVRELLELTNAGNMGGEMMNQMLTAFEGMPGLPDGFIEKFRELAKPQELVDLIVPIYMKHIEASDLDAVIGFFKTEAGKRWITAQKPVMSESMEVGQSWGRELAQNVLKALEEDKAKEREEKKKD